MSRLIAGLITLMHVILQEKRTNVCFYNLSSKGSNSLCDDQQPWCPREPLEGTLSPCLFPHGLFVFHYVQLCFIIGY